MLTTRYLRVEEDHMRYSKLMSRPVTGDAVIFVGFLAVEFVCAAVKGADVMAPNMGHTMAALILGAFISSFVWHMGRYSHIAKNCALILIWISKNQLLMGFPC